MGISYSEVKTYKSEVIDLNDPLVNGKGVGELLVNGDLNGLFPEITATQREDGMINRIKVFVKNHSVDRKMQNLLILISKDILPPDKLKIYPAIENTRLTFRLLNDILGADATVAAGTNIEVVGFLPSGTVIGDFIGRRMTIGAGTYTIASSPTSTTISLQEDVTVNIPADTISFMDDIFDSVEDDTSFIDSEAKVNSVLGSTFTSGSSTVYVPIIEKVHYSIGEKVLILDGYFRIIFRATLVDVQDHGSDGNLATLTLDKTYAGALTIPSGEGFVSGGIPSDIPPGEITSYWAEMTVFPESAVEAEILNEYKVSMHFDDVSA